MFLCIPHTGVFASNYYIIQWISTNGNSACATIAGLNKYWCVRTNTNPFIFIQVAKNQQNQWKKSLGVSECVGTEYVTGGINCLILKLLFRQFHRLVFAPPQKS